MRAAASPHAACCASPLLLTPPHDAQVNKYPGQRTFTAIGSGGDEFRDAMVAAVSSVVGTVHQECVAQRPSSGGQYVSVKIGPVWVTTPEQVSQAWKRGIYEGKAGCLCSSMTTTVYVVYAAAAVIKAPIHRTSRPTPRLRPGHRGVCDDAQGHPAQVVHVIRAGIVRRCFHRPLPVAAAGVLSIIPPEARRQRKQRGQYVRLLVTAGCRL